MTDERRPRRKSHRWRIFGIIVLVLVVLAGVARALLPRVVQNYVNGILDRNTL